MAYESIDKLQNALGELVFHYTQDKKKAAGRALGTMVEIITYYLLKTWGFNNSTSIEKGLTEYGNNDISHNVEYSLHPIIKTYEIDVDNDGTSITATKILNALKNSGIDISMFDKKNNNLYDKDKIVRNACTIAESCRSFLMASLKSTSRTKHIIGIFEQSHKPYAMFECKRVGVEEGANKGPQTIEKAKQGAYVARTASSLQKIRTDTGEKYGIIYRSNNKPYIRPYTELMEEIIYSSDSELLKKFILTVGVVSNHGNWFTAKNQNKELKVLAQSYDWLIFLTDFGLTQFITDLILEPSSKYACVQKAFRNSYAEGKKKNIFTKVKMDVDADNALVKYFSAKINKIESWFNVIAPENKTVQDLKNEIAELRSKNWRVIL